MLCSLPAEDCQLHAEHPPADAVLLPTTQHNTPKQQTPVKAAANVAEATRLLKERAQLLKTGLYFTNSAVITQLNDRIEQHGGAV